MSQPLNLNLLNISPSMTAVREMNPVEMDSFRPRVQDLGRENFESRFQKVLKSIHDQKPETPIRKQEKPKTGEVQEENKYSEESCKKVKRDLEEAIQYLEELLFGGQAGNGDIMARLEKIAEAMSRLDNKGKGENAILENFPAKLMQLLEFDREKQNALLAKINSLSTRAGAFVTAMLSAMKEEAGVSGKSLLETLPKELQALVLSLEKEKQSGNNKPLHSPVLSEGLKQLLAKNANTADGPGREVAPQDGSIRGLREGDSMQQQFGENAEGKNEGKLFDYLFNPKQEAMQNTTQQGVWQGGLTMTQSAEQAVQVPETANTSRWDDRTIRILKQVTAVMAGISKNGVREIQVQLVPEHLGKVQINIEMKDDVMTGRLTVENEAVKQVVESNIQHLKEALESQNIKLDSLEVAVNQDRRFWFARSGDGGLDQGFDRRNQNDKDADEEMAEEKIPYEGGDTGRRLGYNTLELVA